MFYRFAPNRALVGWDIPFYQYFAPKRGFLSTGNNSNSFLISVFLILEQILL